MWDVVFQPSAFSDDRSVVGHWNRSVPWRSGSIFARRLSRRGRRIVYTAGRPALRNVDVQ